MCGCQRPVAARQPCQPCQPCQPEPAAVAAAFRHGRRRRGGRGSGGPSQDGRRAGWIGGRWSNMWHQPCPRPGSAPDSCQPGCQPRPSCRSRNSCRRMQPHSPLQPAALSWAGLDTALHAVRPGAVRLTPPHLVPSVGEHASLETAAQVAPGSGHAEALVAPCAGRHTNGQDGGRPSEQADGGAVAVARHPAYPRPAAELPAGGGVGWATGGGWGCAAAWDPERTAGAGVACGAFHTWHLVSAVHWRLVED